MKFTIPIFEFEEIVPYSASNTCIRIYEKVTQQSIIKVTPNIGSKFANREFIIFNNMMVVLNNYSDIEFINLTTLEIVVKIQDPVIIKAEQNRINPTTDRPIVDVTQFYQYGNILVLSSGNWKILRFINLEQQKLMFDYPLSDWVQKVIIHKDYAYLLYNEVVTVETSQKTQINGGKVKLKFEKLLVETKEVDSITELILEDKTGITSYLKIEDLIWLGMSDGNLVQISLDDLSITHHVQFVYQKMEPVEYYQELSKYYPNDKVLKENLDDLESQKIQPKQIFYTKDLDKEDTGQKQKVLIEIDKLEKLALGDPNMDIDANSLKRLNNQISSITQVNSSEFLINSLFVYNMKLQTLQVNDIDDETPKGLDTINYKKNMATMSYEFEYPFFAYVDREDENGDEGRVRLTNLETSSSILVSDENDDIHSLGIIVTLGLRYPNLVVIRREEFETKIIIYDIEQKKRIYDKIHQNSQIYPDEPDYLFFGTIYFTENSIICNTLFGDALRINIDSRSHTLVKNLENVTWESLTERNMRRKLEDGIVIEPVDENYLLHINAEIFDINKYPFIKESIQKIIDESTFIPIQPNLFVSRNHLKYQGEVENTLNKFKRLILNY